MGLSATGCLRLIADLSRVTMQLFFGDFVRRRSIATVHDDGAGCARQPARGPAATGALATPGRCHPEPSTRHARRGRPRQPDAHGLARLRQPSPGTAAARARRYEPTGQPPHAVQRRRARRAVCAGRHCRRATGALGRSTSRTAVRGGTQPAGLRLPTAYARQLSQPSHTHDAAAGAGGASFRAALRSRPVLG